MAEESDTRAGNGSSEGRLRLDAPYMRTFFSLLVNTLLVSLINFTVWFAITFYVFLQTRSVFATGWIAGPDSPPPPAPSAGRPDAWS